MADTPRIIDGDTLETEDGTSIRDFGADTPESTFENNRQPGGWQAKAHAGELLKGGYSLGDVQGETYGREVRSVKTADGTRLADAQIQAGLAEPTSFSDTGHAIAQLSRFAEELAPRNGGAGNAWQASARRERLARLDALIAGNYPGRMTAMQLDRPAPQGRIDDALERGVAELKMTGNSFLQAVGEVTGFDPLERYGREGVADAMRDAIENPASVASYEDVESLSDAWLYASELFVAELPSLAVDATAAVATGGGSALAAGIGKAFLRNLGGANAAAAARTISGSAFKRGAQAGAFGSMYVQNTGESYMELLREGETDATSAFLVGGAKTALDYTALAGIVGDIGKRFKGGESMDSLGQFFQSALLATGVGGTRESVTEATQTLMDELNKVRVNPDYEIDPSRLIDAGIAGFTVGGTLQGTGTLLGDAANLLGSADRSASPGADDDTVSDTAPEPVSDLAAQLRDRPDGVVHVSASNVSDGTTLAALNAAFDGKLHAKQSPDGSMRVSLNPEALTASPDAPTEADNRQALGYAQSKQEALAAVGDDAEQLRTVEERDAEGNVTRSQVVSPDRADAVVAEAQGRGREARVITPQQSLTDRQARYEAERQALLGTPAPAARQAPQAKSHRLTLPSEQAPADPQRASRAAQLASAPIDALVAQANALGIDHTPYLDRPSEAVDAEVLRDQLERKLDQALESDPDATLQDALDGRKLADLDVADLRAVAKAVGVTNLPRPLKAVKGKESRYRHLLVGDIAGRLKAWKGGERNLPPALKALAPLDAALGALDKTQFKNRDAYAAAARDALPDGKTTRQALARLDTPALHQLAERLSLRTRVPEGVELEFASEEGVDRAGLAQAIVERDSGEAGGYADTARVEADPFRDTPAAERLLGSIAMHRALVPGSTALVDSVQRVPGQEAPISDDQRGRLTQVADGYDGYRMLMSMLSGSLEDRQRQAQAMRQLAENDPEAFVREAQELMITRGVELEAFASETAGIEMTSSAESGRAAGASGVTDTPRPQRNEQEASDHLFFNTLLEGARYTGSDTQAARPVGKVTAKSDSPLHRLRLESANRTERLKERNLAPLTVKTQSGEQRFLFDLVAMASFAQGGEATPTTSLEAARTLHANLSRAIDGIQTELDEAPFVEALRSDFHIPGQAVIAEIDGHPVTYDEALRATREQGIERVETALLADWADRATEIQRQRAAAIDLLIARRALPALDKARGDEAATLRAELERAQELINPNELLSTPPTERPWEARLGRFALTDAELDRYNDLGGRDLLTLVQRYRTTRGELMGAWVELKARARTEPSTDPRVDEIRKSLEMAAGGRYDESLAEAEALSERMDGIEGRDAPDTARPRGRFGDEEHRPVDAKNDGRFANSGMTVDGQLIGDVSTDGTVVEQVEDENGAFDDRNTPSENAMGEFESDDQEVESRRAVKAIAEETQAKVAAWIAANPDKVTRADNPIMPDHGARHNPLPSLYAPREPVRLAGLMHPASGPSNLHSRYQALERFFGRDTVKIEGETDPAVRSFVTQALADFRLTDRRVLVQIGRRPADVVDRLQRQRLLDAEQAETLRMQLEEAPGASYIPVGDVVLVSMPARPAGAGRQGQLGWFHALGHELGHLVYDDYVRSLENNAPLRERVYAAFEKANGFHPEQAPELYMEWFADQAANEMLAAQLEAPAPGQAVSPFQRLARHLRGFFEALQGLMPRYTRYTSFAGFAAAIRSGQTQASRGQSPLSSALLGPTQDLMRRDYDGKLINRAKMAGTRARNHVFKAPPTALYRSVIARIEHYSPALGAALFQRSNSDRRDSGLASYERMHQAIGDRHRGAFERWAGSLGKGKRAANAKAVIQAMERGETTPAVRELRALLAAIAEEAHAKGLKSVQLDPNRVPAAIDHVEAEKRLPEFDAVLKEAFPDEDAKARAARLEVLLNSQGFSEFATAPGLPVGYHDTTGTLLAVVGPARLRELGFLQERSEAVLFHYIDGVAKRTAWEANFGAYTREVSDPRKERYRLIGRHDPQGTETTARGLEKDGKLYDPSGEFKRLMDEVAEKHGEDARRELLQLLDGVTGRSTQRMPRKWRSVNDWVTSWVGMTVLLGSGIASIPEVGLPLVRAHGRVSLVEGLKGFAHGWRFARDAGNILTDLSEQLTWQTVGDGYQSATVTKMNHWFFKANGTQLVMNVSRAMGTAVGIRYLLTSAEMGDTQALDALGVTAAEVRAWSNAGRPVWQPGDTSANNAIAAKVNDAINQFMFEGSSMPSRFQNPGWFNNPYLKMFWMIKRFLYTYGEGIMLGMYRQAKRQWARSEGLPASQRVMLATAPLMMFMVATLPLAMAGLELRDWLRGKPGQELDGGMAYLDYTRQLFSRAGGLGPLELPLMMKQQAEWGTSPLGTLSPVISRGEMWFDWGNDNAMSAPEFEARLRKSLPVLAQMPETWNALFH